MYKKQVQYAKRNNEYGRKIPKGG